MSSIASPSPRRMIEPLPNCFSIWASAACRALAFSAFNAGVWTTGAALTAWLAAGLAFFEAFLVGASMRILRCCSLRCWDYDQELDICTAIGERLFSGSKLAA